MDSPYSLSPLFKLWRILDFRRRRAAIHLGIMILVGTLFETLSIGLVIPDLGLMSKQYFLADLDIEKLQKIMNDLIIFNSAYKLDIMSFDINDKKSILDLIEFAAQ